MTFDELLDETMSHPRAAEPSPFFAARVMSAVRAEASYPPLPFPLWRISTALVLLVFVIVSTASMP